MKPSRLLAMLSCCAALTLAAGVARADAESEGTFWTGYMSSWWLDPSWALWFDTHYNVDSFYMLRGGVTHAFDAGPRVTAGYAFLLLNPDFDRHEHRPWAQVFMPFQLNDDWTLGTRFRMDFRFRDSLENGRVVSGHDFTFRTRFQSMLTRRFSPLRFGRPLVQVGHEVLLNAASSTGQDLLDQNRVKVLFGLEMKRLTIRVGYMHRWLPNARGGDGLHEHAALLWFTQSVDFSGRGGEREKPEYAEDP